MISKREIMKNVMKRFSIFNILNTSNYYLYSKAPIDTSDDLSKKDMFRFCLELLFVLVCWEGGWAGIQTQP